MVLFLAAHQAALYVSVLFGAGSFTRRESPNHLAGSIPAVGNVVAEDSLFNTEVSIISLILFLRFPLSNVPGASKLKYW